MLVRHALFAHWDWAFQERPADAAALGAAGGPSLGAKKLAGLGAERVAAAADRAKGAAAETRPRPWYHKDAGNAPLGVAILATLAFSFFATAAYNGRAE